MTLATKYAVQPSALAAVNKHWSGWQDYVRADKIPDVQALLRTARFCLGPPNSHAFVHVEDQAGKAPILHLPEGCPVETVLHEIGHLAHVAIHPLGRDLPDDVCELFADWYAWHLTGAPYEAGSVLNTIGAMYVGFDGDYASVLWALLPKDWRDKRVAFKVLTAEDEDYPHG